MRGCRWLPRQLEDHWLLLREGMGGLLGPPVGGEVCPHAGCWRSYRGEPGCTHHRTASANYCTAASAPRGYRKARGLPRSWVHCALLGPGLGPGPVEVEHCRWVHGAQGVGGDLRLIPLRFLLPPAGKGELHTTAMGLRGRLPAIGGTEARDGLRWPGKSIPYSLRRSTYPHSSTYAIPSTHIPYPPHIYNPALPNPPPCTPTVSLRPMLPRTLCLAPSIPVGPCRPNLKASPVPSAATADPAPLSTSPLPHESFRPALRCRRVRGGWKGQRCQAEGTQTAAWPYHRPRIQRMDSPRPSAASPGPHPGRAGYGWPKGCLKGVCRRALIRIRISSR